MTAIVFGGGAPSDAYLDVLESRARVLTFVMKLSRSVHNLRRRYPFVRQLVFGGESVAFLQNDYLKKPS